MRVADQKRLEPTTLTADELVERFVELSVAQGHAVSGDDVPTANRLYDQIEAVKQEVQRRDGRSAPQADCLV
jgi:hypothetical protein